MNLMDEVDTGTFGRDSADGVEHQGQERGEAGAESGNVFGKLVEAQQALKEAKKGVLDGVNGITGDANEFARLIHDKLPVRSEMPGFYEERSGVLVAPNGQEINVGTRRILERDSRPESLTPEYVTFRAKDGIGRIVVNTGEPSRREIVLLDGDSSRSPVLAEVGVEETTIRGRVSREIVASSESHFDGDLLGLARQKLEYALEHAGELKLKPKDVPAQAAVVEAPVVEVPPAPEL